MEIWIDYDNARAQAKKLKAVASECEEVVRQLGTALSKIPNHWVGDSATSYENGIRIRIQAIKTLGEKATAQASHILQVVNAYEEAERRIAAKTSGMGDGGGMSSGAGYGGGMSSGHGFGGGDGGGGFR